MITKTPNFAGWKALILAQEDVNTDKLVRQLKLLGLDVARQWKPLEGACLPDLVLVDADQGWDALLPWQGGRPACPVVALLGSEAPGRIAWAISQGAGAIIAKPISAAAVYPALVLSLSIHEERAQASHRISFLEERLKLRPVVFAAIARLKEERGVDDERAYGILRDGAMRRRMPIEQISAYFLGGSEALREVG